MGYALLGENLPEAWDQSVPCFTQEGDEKTGAIYPKFRRNLACHRAAWSLEPHEQSRAASPSDISQRDWRSVEGRDFPNSLLSAVTLRALGSRKFSISLP